MSALKDNAGSATNEKRDWNLGGGSQSVSPRFWKTFLTKMAIAARLLGKEIYRNKLRWFDLRRADYRLGKKAYTVGSSLSDQGGMIDRLSQIQHRIQVLAQSVNSGPSFKEKSRAAMKGAGKAMKILLLSLRRNRLFRKLGRQIRESLNTESSLAAETEHSKAVSERINRVDEDIRNLAARTYLWARRPLLAVSVAFAVTILCAGLLYQQALAGPDVSTPRKAVLAFDDALAQNDLKLARSLTLGDDAQFAAAKLGVDLQRAMHRLAAASTKRFRPADKVEDYATIWEKADEQIETDRATVKGSLGLSFALEKSGIAWRIYLPASGELDKNELAVAQKLLAAVNELRDKIEKGQFKTEQEFSNDFQARVVPLRAIASEKERSTGAQASFAPKTGNPVAGGEGASGRQTSNPRSEDSRAVERYVRSRLAGGLTENQVVELSDAIAEKFDAADIAPKERALCIAGEGGDRQIYLCDIYELAHGELTPPATKAAAEQLMVDIQHLIPPRAVFNSLFENSRSPQRAEAKPLPPKDESVSRNHRTPGSLASEHLEPFKSAIYRLANMKPNASDNPLGYWSQVEQLSNGDVLCCEYQSEEADTWSRPFYFWYQQAPAGLDGLLKKVSADHPIREIGPARTTAPASLQLALNSNAEEANVLQQAIAVDKARLRPPSESKLTARQIVLGIGGLLAAAYIAGEIKRDNEAREQDERLQRIIDASGGTKVVCPKCGGSGKIAYYRPNYLRGPPSDSDILSGPAPDRLIKCDRCGGTRVIDK